MPLLVTSSDPPNGGDRVTVPGDPSSSSGVNLDGVARLFIDTDPTPSFGSLCSATLLSDGQTLLTAAHCLTDSLGALSVLDGGDGNSATFTTGAGTVVRSFTSADVTIHPNYSGDVLDGFDLAVIDLGSPLPASVPRYGLNTSTAIEGNTHVAAGYGRSGDGATGDLLSAGTLRSGLNNFEANGLPVAGITNTNTQLTADFDSGAAANDAFDFFFGSPADLGQGSGEVGVAPGDSGGPSFIIDAGDPLIAGVHSYGLRLQFSGGASSDVDSTLNASFGEFYVDARVAETSMLSFIESNMVSFALGDVDLDGDIDADDIDTLYANLGSGNALYDLDLDGGAADQQDVDELVQNILQTEYGDTDLDFDVDLGDANTLAGTFTGTGVGGWADGDLTGDGLINLSDANLMASTFGFAGGLAASAESAAANVPESSSLMLMIAGGLLMSRRAARVRRAAASILRTHVVARRV